MSLKEQDLDTLCINTVRTLAMDAVQKAESGHPGTAMALAPAGFVLWDRFMNFNPQNPEWLNRDRFVLSNGHAAMLQYALLHITGYDLSVDDIKNYRQWGSKTPGHPEYGLIQGVETTTGPLGQGICNSVGMAMAEAHLGAIYNRENYNIIDHYTYAFCSDGDIMEGASNEAASIAGHFGLGKLIWLYDDNHISIEGPTDITFSDNIAKRFEGYNWHVQDLGEKANDREALEKAFENARNDQNRPSLIIVRSHIAYGAPNKQDDPSAHGSALGEDEVKKTKKYYGWPEDEHFLIPDEVKEYRKKIIERGKQKEAEWKIKYNAYKKEYPELAEKLEAALAGKSPEGWDQNIPDFKPDDGPLATRKASSKVINSIAENFPTLIGGSADLAPSNKTLMEVSDYFERGKYQNRNIAWGVRELGMCGATSGLALYGGIRPFAATFLIFTDYARSAIRLAALMELPVIYVMTHDSIGLGGDGPTHQPVEHLSSFRAMPHMYVIRPADANEVGYAWRAALERTEGPTMLVLTRQKVSIFDRNKVSSARGLMKGAYILSKEKGDTPDAILIATGSEVQLALSAQEKLDQEDIDVRVVSMPSWELFRDQPESYRSEVLPENVKSRVAIEAASPVGWHEWVGDQGRIIGVTKFGASANYKDNFKHYGFTVEHVVEETKNVLEVQHV